jgi:cysteine desulfurase
MNKNIYLDNNSSTFCDEIVAKEIHRMLIDNCLSNPHALEHRNGWESMKVMDQAKRLIAQNLGALPSEIFFTSGATESNNLAIMGIIESAFLKNDKRKKIITTNIEHKCVLNAMHAMKDKYKLDLVLLKVDEGGFVDLKAFEKHASDALLASIIHTNNEIGVVQNIEKLGAIASKHDVIFHVDASQGMYSDIDVVDQSIDLLSLSGHKIYAPIGVGVLFINSNLSIKPMSVYSGGSQQDGVRAGTISPVLSYATALALDLLNQEKDNEIKHLNRLRALFIKLLEEKNIRFKINGSMEQRHPGNLNLTLLDIESSSSLIYKLQPQLSFSSGSACNSGTIEPSYVLEALGLHSGDIDKSIRIGFGRFNTEEEITKSIDLISTAVM